MSVKSIGLAIKDIHLDLLIALIEDHSFLYKTNKGNFQTININEKYIPLCNSPFQVSIMMPYCDLINYFQIKIL